MDIKYQESVKTWHRIILARELIIIALSVLFMCVLVFLMEFASINEYQFCTAKTGVCMFFISLFFSFISINQTQEKISFDIADNGIKYDKSVLVVGIQTIGFYLGLVSVMLFVLFNQHVTLV